MALNHTYKVKNIKIILFINKKKIKANLLNVNIDDIEYNVQTKVFKIKNYCNEHNEFDISYYDLRNRIKYKIENICTNCNPINNHTSIAENEVLYFIKGVLNVNPIKYKIENKEIDIFIPEYNLGIEYNGLYWHSDNKLGKKYHLNKTNLAEKNSIQLLHIFENEWKNKKEIIKSIIRSKFNIFFKIVNGDNCNINLIDKMKAKNFLNKNHIEGYIEGNINLGLFNEDELISVMTLNLKHNKYEILRFGNLLNIHVINSMKIFSNYIMEKYNPSEIIGYLNRRFYHVKDLKELNLNKIEFTNPNYWYFKSHEYILYHPSKITKEKINNEKYYRIYDSGNIKFTIKLE